MIVSIDNQIPRYDSYPVERTRGLYNVGVEDGSRFQMDVDVPIDRDDWQIGVVVGPSGSGKTSIARAIHGEGWEEWAITPGHGNPEVPVIEQLCWNGDYGKATAALAAVGLGSVPSWLRPPGVLSNGEFFRFRLAQLLLATTEKPEGGPEEADWPPRVYVDEFTSVLDRQVAKIGAGAFAKAWRRRPQRQVILITPHYDILDWVEPDWWIDTAEGADEFASDRGVVQARTGTFQEAHDRARYPGDRVATLEC